MTLIPETVAVTAPSDLPEGYELHVTVEGDSSMVVTVPAGGVTQGQTFTAVPHPPVTSTIPKTTVTTPAENSAMTTNTTPNNPIHHHDVVGGGSTNNNPMNIPVGHFRDDFCACCQHFCTPLFWLSACCAPLTQAQIMDRLGLDLCAEPNPARQGMKAFNLVLILILGSLLLSAIAGVGGFLYLGLLIYILIVMTKTRGYIRNKYAIPGSCFCDCCTSFWCECCTVIQMSSHITDYSQYKSTCCTENGLRADAPDIV